MSDLDARIDHLSEIVANLAKAGPASANTRQVDDLIERVEELQAELKGLASRKPGVGLDVVQNEIRKATNALPAAIVPPLREKFDAVEAQVAEMKDVTKRQTEAQLHDMRQMNDDTSAWMAVCKSAFAPFWITSVSGSGENSDGSLFRRSGQNPCATSTMSPISMPRTTALWLFWQDAQRSNQTAQGSPDTLG